MPHPASNIVADGARRLRATEEFRAARARIFAAVRQRYEEERPNAGLWRQLWIRCKIEREARAEVTKMFPPGALHATRQTP